MKQEVWESIRLMLWAWELGSGTALPPGLRDVLDKAEELLAGAAETGALMGSGEEPAKEAPAPGPETAEEPDPLAVRLLDYMKSRELNASRVAKDLGCNSQTLRNILTGKTAPSRRVEAAIRGYLETRGQEAPGAE